METSDKSKPDFLPVAPWVWRGAAAGAILIVSAAMAINWGPCLPGAGSSKAMSDIRAIDTSCTAIQSDAQVDTLADLFVTYPGKDFQYTSSELAYAALDGFERFHSDAMYSLLRNGRNAVLPDGFEMKPDLRQRLSTSYINIGRDPWRNRYQIFIGPWPEGGVASPFRRYAYVEGEDGLRTIVVPERYEGEIAENDPYCGAPGVAPKHGVYVWSRGGDGESGVGGTGCRESDNDFRVGDDINNWDPGRGWKMWY